MAERSARPSSMPWLSVYLTVANAEVASEYYQKAFGFTEAARIPGADGKPVHVELRWNDARVVLGPVGALDVKRKPPATSGNLPPFFLYIYCDDVDTLFKRAVEAGAKVDEEPADQFWGDRTCTLVDPNGYVWTFARNIGEFDPTKIPLPSSFTM